jgi:hypothetical protein
MTKGGTKDSYEMTKTKKIIDNQFIINDLIINLITISSIPQHKKGA